MTKFIYNNVNNGSIGHILFELNYDYHFHISLKMMLILTQNPAPPVN